MRVRWIHSTIWFLTAAGVCALRAQAPAPAADTSTIGIGSLKVVSHSTVDSKRMVDVLVRFNLRRDLKHPEDMTESNITVVATPSGSKITLGRIDPIANTGVSLPLMMLPDAKDDSIKVCFGVLHFLKTDDPKTYTSPAGTPVCATSKVMTQEEAGALVDQENAAAAKAKADKTSSEKDIFASGFVTTAGQSNTQGGADVSLNNFLSGLPGANTFLQIQKTSLSNGDPRHFEAGLSWRHTTSFDPTRDKQIQADVKAYDEASNEAEQKAAGSKIKADADKYGVWLGALEDFAIKMEGDPTQFKAVNAVGDGDVRILTRTLKLFGSTNGYFRARPLVVGFEGGKSIGTGDATTTATTTTSATTSTSAPGVDWIARGKVGADFTLFYDNPKATSSPIKRVEINAGGVERYLFLKEINYDATTMKDSAVGKGSRPYFQSDVKVFFYEDPKKGRAGVRMAYTRGSLPPVFADVKSFQFGFVYETADDKATTKADKTKTAGTNGQ
jgi:hypothetical protein